MNDLEKAELQKNEEAEISKASEEEQKAKNIIAAIAETNKNLDHMESLCKQVRDIINGDTKTEEKLQAVIFFNAVKNVSNAVTLLNNQLTPEPAK